MLSRKRVELMLANQLGQMERKTTEFNEFEGFGLGGAVRIDPKQHLLTLVFAQHFPFDEQGLFWRFATLVYSAMAD